jgi:hypothetical protein
MPSIWPCGGFVWLESGSPSKGGKTGPEPRSRTLPWNLAVPARLWSAPAERSGDGALAQTGRRADGSQPGARFVCPRTLLSRIHAAENHRWTQMNTDKDCPKPSFFIAGIRSPDSDPKQGEAGPEFSPQNLCSSVSICGWTGLLQMRGLGRINNSLRLTLVGVFLPT